MFKVVCINDKTTDFKKPVLVKEGEIYTVIGENPYDGGYILLEVLSPYNIFGAFKKERFRKLDAQFGHDVATKIEEQIKEEILILNN